MDVLREDCFLGGCEQFWAVHHFW